MLSFGAGVLKLGRCCYFAGDVILLVLLLLGVVLSCVLLFLGRCCFMCLFWGVVAWGCCSQVGKVLLLSACCYFVGVVISVVLLLWECVPLN